MADEAASHPGTLMNKSTLKNNESSSQSAKQIDYHIRRANINKRKLNAGTEGFFLEHTGGEILDIERQKVRMLEKEINAEQNPDLLFFRSLLPYLQDFTPTQKLQIRSKIQNLILAEHEAMQQSSGAIRDATGMIASYDSSQKYRPLSASSVSADSAQYPYASSTPSPTQEGMSSDKRRNCRIQGGSSSFGLQNEKRKGKREVKQTKSKYGNAEDGKERIKTNGEKYKEQEASHKTEENLKVTYVENSSYDLPIPEPIKPPVEVKDKGMQVLSKTENGESRIVYYPSFLADDSELFRELHGEIDWCQMNVVIHGKEYPQPRLVAWFGPFAYGYSGVLLEPQEIPDNIVKIKERLEKFLAEDGIPVEFNSVLLNLYQHGKHSVAWHSDDELSMGIHPTIASISLGEIRKFEMRRKPTEKNPEPRTEYFVNLKSGSLLVMDGVMQKDWQHRVPKEGGMEISPRINLTFRKVYKIERVSRTSK